MRAPQGYPKFVSGQELSNAVKWVLGGDRAGCAVAFLGRGFADLLSEAAPKPASVRIVCDVTMGGTSPVALRELGAPRRKRLRHWPGLHAKVYVSDRGAVIGSANASDNGLGFGSSGPGTCEAGSAHGPDDPVRRSAAEWFDGLYGDADPIGRTALDLAQERFANHPPAGKRAEPRPGSLLELVLRRPMDFADIGFVIASERSTPAQRDHAREAAKRDRIADNSEIEGAPDEGMFIGWRRQAGRWRTTFIEFWMARDRLTVFYRSLIAVHRNRGEIFSRQDPEAVTSLLPKGSPSRASIQRADAELIAKLRDAGKTFFPTAQELAAALETLT